MYDGGGLMEGSDEGDGFSQTHTPNCNWQEMVNGEDEYEIYAAGSFPEAPSFPDLVNMYPSSSLLLPCSAMNMHPSLLPSPALNFLYHSGDFDGIGISGDVKHSASERQKRKDFNLKYKALRDLIPNPTKDDRASIVGDTIDYIKELKKAETELKLVVEKKKKRRVKSEENAESSWVQRKSRNAEVDVRIMENDVCVKLVVQRRRINCLLFVAKALDELQLELHHVSGGAIGDFYAYLINSKISQGLNVYAAAVANKLIQVVDQHYITTN